MARLPFRARGTILAILFGLMLALGSATPALAHGEGQSLSLAHAYGMNTASYSTELMRSGGYGGGGGRGYASARTLVFVPRASHVRFVPIYNFAFHPASLVAERGTTVVWINESNVPHTVTFNNGIADSGIIYPGHAVSFTFTRVGTFAYHCRIHPFMHGRVTVTP